MSASNCALKVIEVNDNVIMNEHRTIHDHDSESLTTAAETTATTAAATAAASIEDTTIAATPVAVLKDAATTAASISTTAKRSDYLEWPEYFMAVAFLSAMRSKDPSTQVGACIVNKDKKIVGIGYNGMPNGCSDDDLPWQRQADDILDTKYPYVCHAELNAILNKNCADTLGCTLYVAMFPCNECAKLIIQSGIKEIIYASDKYGDKSAFKASRILLDMARVKHSQFVPKRRQIVIDFTAVDLIGSSLQ